MGTAARGCVRWALAPGTQRPAGQPRGWPIWTVFPTVPTVLPAVPPAPGACWVPSDTQFSHPAGTGPPRGHLASLAVTGQTPEEDRAPEGSPRSQPLLMSSLPSPGQTTAFSAPGPGAGHSGRTSSCRPLRVSRWEAGPQNGLCFLVLLSQSEALACSVRPRLEVQAGGPRKCVGLSGSQIPQETPFHPNMEQGWRQGKPDVAEKEALPRELQGNEALRPARQTDRRATAQSATHSSASPGTPATPWGRGGASAWLTWQALGGRGWLRALILSRRLKTAHDCYHKLSCRHTHVHRAEALHGSSGEGWGARNELENTKAQTPLARCRAPPRAPAQRAKARGPLCSGAPESRGSGVHSLEAAGAAAGSALRGRAEQTAVREAGAVWHSRHFSTSIKPACSGPRGRGKGVPAVGSLSPCSCPPTPPGSPWGRRHLLGGGGMPPWARQGGQVILRP